MNTRAFAVLATLVIAAAGCAPDRMSLEAYAICSMPDTCSFSGSCEAYALGVIGYRPGAGTADAWLAFGVELRNQLLNNANSSVARVNSNDAHITGVQLEIDGPTSGTIALDVGHQAVPAEGTAVVWTYVLPPTSITSLAAGTYTVNVVYVGHYDNGKEFETGGFPVAVEVEASTTAYGCVAPDVITCGSAQQALFACGAP